MDFVAIILFLAVYYVRPQEWYSVLSTLRPVTLVMAFAILSLFFRERGLRWKTLVKTPHEWLMLIYFIYLTLFVPSDSESYAVVRNSFIIYFVIVQVLTGIQRLRLYLYWWAGFIFFIVMLALASEVGIDPLGAKYSTDQVYRGRLVLTLSIFDNPNALGHSVVPVLAMLYFLLIWRRPIFLKELGALALIPPIWCVYLTESKGAFVAGFVAIVAGLIVGRPKLFQIAVLILALTAGWAGVKQLPRMQDLRNPRQEEGIQGRLKAWEFGLEKMRAHRNGLGFFQFGTAFQKENGFFKAAHSSFVEVGAEQGYVGLLLFVGVLYTCFRTLLTTKIIDEEEERLRRILLVIVCAYTISSWMIGWGYRTTFFVMVACVAAFHRLLRAKIEQEAELLEELEGSRGLLPAPVLGTLGPVGNVPGAEAALRTATMPGLVALAMAPAPQAPPEPVEKKPRPKFWYRLGLLDGVLIYAGAHATVKIWEYVLKKI